MLIKLCFYRERVRRNPKVDRIGSLFLVYILNYIKNEYCEWQNELDMINTDHQRWCILSKINQLTVFVGRWLVKNHNIAINSTTTREKTSTDLESLDFHKKLMSV